MRPPSRLRGFRFRRPRTHVMRAAVWPIRALISLIEALIMFGLVSLSFVGGVCAAIGVANLLWARAYGTYFWQTMPQLDRIPGGFVGLSIMAAVGGEAGIRLVERIFRHSSVRRSRPAKASAAHRSLRVPLP